MSEQVNSEKRGCRNCPHSNPPNADGSCSAYGYNGVDCSAQPCVCRNHVLSERSPAEVKVHTAPSGRRYVDIDETIRHRLDSERSPERHPYWNDTTPCAICSHMRSRHLKGEGQCTACGSCRFFVRPQPPAEAALCVECGHGAGTTGSAGKCVFRDCDCHCTFPAPVEEPPKSLTIEEYQAEYLRLCNWRELWLKLANKREPGRLQSRQEAIESRAALANHQIKLLMQSYDVQTAQVEPVKAAAVAEAPLTVMAALVELRELFPGEINLGVHRSGGDGYIAQHGHIELRRERWSVHRRVIEIIGSGASLAEAMQQARDYATEDQP